MSTVAGFSTINHYRDLSYSQLSRMNSITNRVVKLDITDASNAKEVLDWERVAIRLNTSINAQRPFFRAVFDVLTLQFIKKWILQIRLPSVISSTTVIANQVRAQIPAPKGRRKVKAKVKPSITTSTTSTTTTRSTTPTNPLYDPSKAADPEAILATVLKAQECFLSNKNAVVNNFFGTNALSKEVEKEVNEYFQEKINLLLAKEVVALPLFYHATHDHSLVDIINNGHLKPGTRSMYGVGVYFSTEDESYTGFGSHTFAVDSNVIYKTKAAYMQVQSGVQPGQHHALWVCVEKEVPIEWKSVAHIVVGTQADKVAMLDKLVNNDGSGLDAAALGIISCPVLTRKASDVVRKAFQKAHTYKLPSCWKSYSIFTNPTKAALPYVQV